jgi:hypothetical protein
MPKKTIILVLCILFLAVGVAQAQVSITYSCRGKQQFTMDISDNWQVNVGSEAGPAQMSEGEKEPARLISAMPNDGVPLWFGMWVPDGLKKIASSEEYMESLGLELLDDIVATERKFDLLNSMEVYYVSGTGNKEGEAMDFRAVFVQLTPESVAIAIYIGPSEATSRYGKDLVQMIHSLQPVIQ